MTELKPVQIKAVVFDIGGVLLDWNPRYLYRELFDDEEELERFLGTVCTSAWHRAHDLGVDTEQSCQDLALVYPEYEAEIMAWSRRSEDMVAGQFDDAVEILADLAGAGVPCYILSNMEPDKYELRRARYEFFGLARGCVISGLEGVAKPDREIFEILLARFGLEPGETVFADDQPANVAAAGELGVVALEYTTAAQLRRELHELGLPAGLTSRRPRRRHLTP